MIGWQDISIAPDKNASLDPDRLGDEEAGL